MKRWLYGFTQTACLVLCLPSAGTAAQLFVEETEFLAANPALRSESFEGGLDGPRTPQPIDTGTLVVTPLLGSQIQVLGGGSNRGTPTDGDFFLQLDSPVEDSVAVRFDLPDLATAFALSVIDFGDLDNPGTLQLRTDRGAAAAGLLIDSVPPGKPNGSVQFFGFVQETPFSWVVLENSSIPDGVFFDELYFNTVPEPASVLVAVVALGLVTAVGSARG